jgi:cytochrome c biogenesis protein CcmG/thiol:disulfide interchange protein DsbE
MNRTRLAVVVLAVVTLSGCSTSGQDAGVRVTPTETPTASVAAGDATAAAPIDPCPESGPPLGRGDGLPELELPCLGPGDDVQLAGLEGRPRLVNVWASWCPPCRAEMPWLQQAHESGEIDVLGIDAEDEVGAASALLSDLDITFPSVFDPANTFAREIRNLGKPTTLLVSKDGEVVYVQSGPFRSYDDLRDVLGTYLKVDLP